MGCQDKAKKRFGESARRRQETMIQQQDKTWIARRWGVAVKKKQGGTGPF